MKSQMVNFMIPENILEKSDKLAKKEGRSRSDLFREAIRRYLLSQFSQEEDFALIKESADKINLSEEKSLKLVEKNRQQIPLN